MRSAKFGLDGLPVVPACDKNAIGMGGKAIDLNARSPFGGKLGTDLAAQGGVANENGGPAFRRQFGKILLGEILLGESLLRWASGELGEDVTQFVEEGGLVLRGVRHGNAFGLVEVDSGFLAGWGKFEAGEVVESVGGAVDVCAGV